MHILLSFADGKNGGNRINKQSTEQRPSAILMAFVGM
jgi:hypothetical protein